MIVFSLFKGYFDHDDAGIDRLLRLAEAELEPHIQDGYDTASQVYDAPHVIRGFRHLCHRRKLQYLPHVRDIQSKDLFSQVET